MCSATGIERGEGDNWRNNEPMKRKRRKLSLVRCWDVDGMEDWFSLLLLSDRRRNWERLEIWVLSALWRNCLESVEIPLSLSFLLRDFSDAARVSPPLISARQNTGRIISSDTIYPSYSHRTSLKKISLL